MIVAEIERSNSFISTPRYIEPFILECLARYYTYESFWTDIFGATDDSSTLRQNVIGVTQDFLNKYDVVYSYNDCKAQEQSFYFDKTNQLIYIHINHSESINTCLLDYSYAFGVCGNADVTYIDDVEYLPIIASRPSLAISSDVVGSAKPVKIVGSLTLNNSSTLVDGKPVGVLDFMLNESVYGNDVVMYNYDGTTLDPIAYLAIENISISQREVTMDLQDRRYT